ncbi:MAG: DNA-directed RNA polymerase subunit alpha C-terminal domain-containing protein, partial [Planctomycetota bacterium]
GETSLREIKEMLVSRGLRLGMLREDGSPSQIFDRSKPAAPSAEAGSMDHVPIDDLELSVRSRKCMERLAIHTMGQLLAMSEADLVAAKNFGRVSLQEIKNKLAERSMSLRA